MDIRQVPGNVSAGSSSACLLPCRRLRSAPMPARGKLRPGAPLAAALAAGLVVRVVRLLRDPLMHPDGPAYLELARALLRGKVLAVLGGYYSPLYPAAVAGLAATGLRLELAGRATALLAGLAALPLVHALARRCAGERAADAAVLVAAVHPALVKASAQVLPETLAGALLLAWLVARRAAIAGALAGGAYLARPEGVLLLPLGLWRPPPRAPPRARPLCGRRRGRHGAGAARAPRRDRALAALAARGAHSAPDRRPRGDHARRGRAPEPGGAARAHGGGRGAAGALRRDGARAALRDPVPPGCRGRARDARAARRRGLVHGAPAGAEPEPALRGPARPPPPAGDGRGPARARRAPGTTRASCDGRARRGARRAGPLGEPPVRRRLLARGEPARARALRAGPGAGRRRRALRLRRARAGSGAADDRSGRCARARAPERGAPLAHAAGVDPPALDAARGRARGRASVRRDVRPLRGGRLVSRT